VIGRLRRRVARGVRHFCARQLVTDASNRFSRENLDALLEREIASLEARPGGPRRVLNVGAGGPLAQRVARIRAGQVVSVDLDPARRPDVTADVCDLRCFEDATFDAAFVLEVLEHVVSPDLAISELRRVLAPRGVLVLSTPFLFEIHEGPHDYYRFTEHGLRHLLRGFDDCTIVRRNGYLKATLVPLLRLTRSRYVADNLVGLALLAVCSLAAPLIGLLDRAIRSDTATTGYFVTCRHR
jgi:SAM-dependent methyltransferase